MSSSQPTPDYLEARVGLELDGRNALPIDPRAKAIKCPWCGANPGTACVSTATGKPLRITAAHNARYHAASLANPVVDREALREPLSDDLADGAA